MHAHRLMRQKTSPSAVSTIFQNQRNLFNFNKIKLDLRKIQIEKRMRRRFPLLNALRAFEAASRHGSLSGAATELSVTTGAVSRQISRLESYLDDTLFFRNPRGVELTAKGLTYANALTEAFDRIDAATEDFRGHTEPSSLSVFSFTTLAIEWLLPNLDSFRALHPSIDLKLVASSEPVGLYDGQVDVGLWIGPEHWPGIHFDELFYADHFPVCSPALLENGPPLRNASDLRHHTLLYSTARIPNWPDWLNAAGAGDLVVSREMRFENSSNAYRAARDGLGIALGQRLFVAEDIAAGRLVVPLPLSIRSQQSYCIVCLEARRTDWKIEAFRNWIASRVAETEALSQSVLPADMKVINIAGDALPSDLSRK
ncbi:MAG: transcriptional regulator GcvA [Alphaproteobacteria bacterium]|nr:transcriptional regulator GcvA [Alphaproteobacteria bacterium]